MADIEVLKRLKGIHQIILTRSLGGYIVRMQWADPFIGDTITINRVDPVTDKLAIQNAMNTIELRYYEYYTSLGEDLEDIAQEIRSGKIRTTPETAPSDNKQKSRAESITPKESTNRWSDLDFVSDSEVVTVAHKETFIEKIYRSIMRSE